MIPILSPNTDNLRQAALALKSGKLIALPTETVYGLGAHAFNPTALASIFEVKQRPFFDPLIIHIATLSELKTLCSEINDKAKTLIKKFWPGPLTLVLPKSLQVPDIATAGLSSVAVRMPAHPVAQALLKACGFPIAAPSANPFGRLSPTTAEHVQAHFSKGIEFILDGGPCSIGVESTILSLMEVTPVLLRAGGITREEIEALIGPIRLGASVLKTPQAPGQLEGHYAPRTLLRLVESGSRPISDANVNTNFNSNSKRIGFLAFQTSPTHFDYASVEILSNSGDLNEAATHLFSCLHRMDKLNLDLIEVEAIPKVGLGVAIMDRLEKAEAGSAKLF